LSMRQQRYHGLRNALLAGLALVAGAWWRRRRPFRVAVEGTSMSPTLEEGDFLIAIRPRVLHAGTLVVIEHPERRGFEMVKRLSAGPGSVIEGLMLGPDEWWVIGDLPSASTDSRSFGAVRASAIRGEVLARYWPPSRAACFC
jgi:nickel-type superoxide dismutase maturation protease